MGRAADRRPIVGQRSEVHGAALPALDAVEMEDVAAIAEGNGQTIVVGRGRVGLILDGGLVEGVAADGAGVGTNVPGPHGDRVPLLDLKAGRRRSLLLLGLVGIKNRTGERSNRVMRRDGA